MNLENQNNNMRELDQRVEQLLTPRFAPSVENFKLELKPRKARYAWLFSAMRIGGVAAALIVGLFALIGPNNTATAKVYEASQYAQIDKMPTFQNEDATKFAYWLSSNIEYPQEAIEQGIEGKVVFSFIVEQDGSLSDFKVLQSPSEILDKEIERVFNTSPQWEPGEHMGEKIRVRFTVPVILIFR